MFEDLEDNNSFKVETVTKQEPSQSNSYKPNGGYNKSGFKPKEDVVQDPYVPVAIFCDRDFPDEVKTSLFNIASKLLAKKITVRVNGDDKDFIEKLKALSDTHLELYIPWKNFNEIESKFYFNNLTCKHIAEVHFSAWEKIPDAVKALLARNVRLIFGEKNNSVALCVITWSKDGASRVAEISKDTGRASFIIKVAASYGFPVINITKQSTGNILEKTFGI